MKIFLFVFLATLVFLLFVELSKAGTLGLKNLQGFHTCGSWRWDVKTLSDENNAYVAREVKNSNITQLDQLRPPPLTRDTPRFGFEYNLYRIEGIIVYYKKMADNDWHVVLQNGRTMIVEFPAPACVASSPFRARIVQARKSFDRLVQSRRVLGTRVLLYGSLFFDQLHGQKGAAANGAEIHPVLGLEVIDS